MGASRLPENLVALAVSLAVTSGIAAIGAAASLDAGSFYAGLTRPGWAPPAWLFGPGWTALYALMAVAAWLVWLTLGAGRAIALAAFGVQLVLNALWSWLFFAWYEGALAFIDIVVLWIAIVVNLVLFWRLRPLAGVLLLPYLTWVSFAAALNFSIWQRNPVVLG